LFFLDLFDRDVALDERIGLDEIFHQSNNGIFKEEILTDKEKQSRCSIGQIYR
jgi:hypothetical protein